jgi:hypothetical protein
MTYGMDHPQQQLIVGAYLNVRPCSIFGFGEYGGSASFQLAKMLVSYWSRIQGIVNFK